jgi:hypothetical protein
MSHHSIRNVAALAAAISAGAFMATPAYAGPPWISAEFPANPHEAATRGAFLLIHTYHHGTPMQFPLTGTAEGLVGGRRQTVRLEIVSTSKPGVYAVRFSPQERGAWVLAFNLGNEGGAGMLVAVGKDGTPASVKVPSTTAEGGRWVIPRTVTKQDIESALRAQTALNGMSGQDLGAALPGGALIVLGLVLGIPLVRKVRQ